MTESTIVQQIYLSLQGRTPTAIALGYGSILLVDFSDRFHLRVECAWRLETAVAVLAASEDQRDSIREVLEKLPPATESRIEVELPAFELRLSFGAYRLKVFPFYAENGEYENWTIHTPGGQAIVAGPGRQMQIVSSGEPP